MGFAERLTKAALKQKKYSSVAEFAADVVKFAQCHDCGHQFEIEKIKLQKIIECPQCGAKYDNYAYDEKAAKAARKKIRKPENCVYDFSEGIYPCLSKSSCCERECYFRNDQEYSFANGKCNCCGAGLNYDGYCENDCE